MLRLNFRRRTKREIEHRRTTRKEAPTVGTYTTEEGNLHNETPTTETDLEDRQRGNCTKYTKAPTEREPAKAS